MRLIAVGLGPGDPELVTVKAAKVLSEARTVVVPYSSNRTASLAEGIVRKYSSKARIVTVRLPMRKEIRGEELDFIAKELCKELEGESEAVYATLGDPTIYSTVFRFASRMPCVSELELVPGVTSFTACANKAQINLALGDEGIAVVPAHRVDLIKLARGAFETVIVMKGSLGLTEATKLLEGYRITYARRCYMEGEEIGSEVKDDDYFSLVIARWEREGEGR